MIVNLAIGIIVISAAFFLLYKTRGQETSKRTYMVVLLAFITVFINLFGEIFL